MQNKRSVPQEDILAQEAQRDKKEETTMRIETERENHQKKESKRRTAGNKTKETDEEDSK